MKKTLTIALIALLTAASTGAAATDMHADSTLLNIYDIDVTVDESARKLHIGIDVDINRCKVGSERELIFTPMLFAAGGTDSLALDPVVIAGRNRWYHYMRDGILDVPGNNIFRAGRPVHAKVSETLDLEPWMQHSTVEMRVEKANCCDKALIVPGDTPAQNVLLAEINTARPALIPDFVFAPPVDAAPVIRSIEGSAFITFVVNRTELKPDYMVNRREIAKIINSIDYVRNDSDATITRVHIKGFASPEGPYANNVRLAQGRTETLRRYVRDLYSFPDTTITSSYEPEDWQGLRKYIADSMQFSIAHRPEILEVIDSPLAPDDKDRTLKKRFPADYTVILKQIYPWLRHSDYKVTYAIKTYTTLAEIKRAYEADPTRLRTVDFYTLAQSYPVRGKEYSEVFRTAVATYPDDPMLNLNAANLDMAEGNLDAAQLHLLKSGGSPQANYARGVLAARRADYDEAIRFFTMAKDAGMAEAGQYIIRANEIKRHQIVNYHITPLSKPTKK